MGKLADRRDRNPGPVLSPDGNIVRKLPGQGCHINANRAADDQFDKISPVESNQFSEIF
jgi:hypothetical protein